MDADKIEARVWAAVTELLTSPERLMQMAAEYLELRAGQMVTERGELARLDAEISKLDKSLNTTVVEYLREGLPVDAVKAATEAIKGDLLALRKRRDDLNTWREDSRAESDKMRAVWALAERANAKLVVATLEEQTEVIALLDIKVEVLDRTTEPRLSVLGFVPFAAAAGDRADEAPRYLAQAVTSVPFRLVA